MISIRFSRSSISFRFSQKPWLRSRPSRGYAKVSCADSTGPITRVANWRSIVPFGCRWSFSVFYDAHHLNARSITLLEVPAGSAGNGAKDLVGKLLVDHGHGRRVFVVMPCEGPSREQGGARSMEVFGRYAEREG